MVLLVDSLMGFERNTPYFEQLFAPQLIRNMAACEAWRSYLLPFFFFVCVVSFLFAWFLFCLRSFIFLCVVSFLLAWFLFCSRVSFFICLFSFLFACFLFCLRGFLFCLCAFFFVCSMSLVGHRRDIMKLQSRRLAWIPRVLFNEN